MLLVRTASFDFVLANAALLGVVRKSDYPPLKVYQPSIAVGICLLGLFCFTRCIPNALDFWQNLEKPAAILRVPLSVFVVSSIFGGGPRVSGKFPFVLPAEVRCLIFMSYQPCPIWTFIWGLRSWGSFRSWLSSIINAEVVVKSFQSILRDLDWLVPYDIIGGICSCCWVWYYWGSPLCSCCRVFDRLANRLAALLSGSWFSKFSILSGLRNSWRECFALVSGVPGILIPAFCCSRLKKNNISSGWFHSHQKDFCVVLCPHVLWGEEDKIEVIEKFVSSVLRFFNYRLTLSPSDFSKYRMC